MQDNINSGIVSNKSIDKNEGSSIGQTSSVPSRKESAEAVFDLLASYFFNQVNFLTSPGNTNSTTTRYSSFRTLLRVPDTAAGKHLRPDKKSKMRTVVYVSGGAEHAEFYILSPTLYRSSSLADDINTISTSSAFEAYVGIKVTAGVVSLVTKFSGTETTIPTDVKFIGSTTYLIEISFNGTHAEISVDGISLGSVECNMLSNINNIITFYPLFCPIRSLDATYVNLNAENYQYIQDK